MEMTKSFPMRGWMFLAGAGCLTWFAASFVQAQGPGMGGMGKGGCGMGKGGCGMEMGMGMHKGGMPRGGMGRPPMEMMGMGRGMGMPPGMGGMGMGRPPMEMMGMGRGGMGMPPGMGGMPGMGMPPGMGGMPGMGMANQAQGIGGAGMLRPGGDLGAINGQNNFNQLNQNFANQGRLPNQNPPKVKQNMPPQDNVQQALMNRGKAVEARKEKLQRENDGGNNP